MWVVNLTVASQISLRESKSGARDNPAKPLILLLLLEVDFHANTTECDILQHGTWTLSL